MDEIFHSAMRQFFSSELPHAIPLEFAQGFVEPLPYLLNTQFFFRQSKVLPYYINQKRKIGTLNTTFVRRNAKYSSIIEYLRLSKDGLDAYL